MAERAAIVQQRVAAGGVNREGQSKPPVELQWEISSPHSNYRNDLQSIIPGSLLPFIASTFKIVRIYLHWRIQMSLCQIADWISH